MPRRRTKTEAGIVVYVLAAIAIVIMALLNFILDNIWILWVLVSVAIIAIAARLFYVRKTKELQEEERQREEQRLQVSARDRTFRDVSIRKGSQQFSQDRPHRRARYDHGYERDRVWRHQSNLHPSIFRSRYR